MRASWFIIRAVVGIVKRMKPKVDDVIRQKQGSMDPESAWAVARTIWAT